MRQPVFFKIPANWSEMSEEEKARFAEEVLTAILAQADLDPRTDAPATGQNAPGH